jgi:F-type H+-transporting ATPase subunit gamma
MALKQVKNKIIATKKTGQVTKAMEAVSAVKMRKSQEKAFVGRPYVRSALRILARISRFEEASAGRYFGRPEAGRELLIVVTSDKGLAGSVNSAVLKQVDQLVAKGMTPDVIAVGRKALEHARRVGLAVVAEFINVADDVTIDNVYSISSQALQAFDAGRYSKVSIVYQNFISTFEQSPTMRQILPLNPAEIEYVMRGIKPKNGKWSDDSEVSDKAVDYIVEPSAEEVIKHLIPSLINIMVYHALIESKASEHSARMVAMKNATDKSKEVIKSLTIRYNKERQTAITAEVSEITAGVEAMQT